MEIVDIYQFLEDKVIEAYEIVSERLSAKEIAPDLHEVYDEFFLNVIDDMEEVVEEVFGDGAKVNENTLRSVGINPEGIPTIHAALRILTMFRLGFMYKGRLYNYQQHSLFRDEDVNIIE